ncbi:MAG TPA: MFS transporter [Candidatus Paceibacterota bacterium]|nr:MFS transporter [Verrucomicrobiota bacterium]HRY49898.1 MFS transporter [Candidatus Paceibacterota bacterium]
MTNLSLLAAARQYLRDFNVLRETRREYWGIQIVNLLDCTIYFALLNIASVFLSDDLGMSDEHAGYSISLFTTATTILLFFSGTVTDWLGIRRSTYVAMLAQGALRLGLVVVGLAPSIPHRGWLATGLLFLMAPFMAMIQTVFQSANQRFTTVRSRSAGFSLWYLFMNIGAAAGGFLIDIIRKLLDLPNAHVFTAGVGLAALCCWVTFWMIRREDQLRGDTAAGENHATETVIRKNPLQIARAVVREPALWRLLVLVTFILGARAIFSYLYLLFPKYWLRTIGEGAAIGTLQAINPILIVLGVIVFIPLMNRFNLFSMLVYGSLISALSLVFLAVPWQWFSADIGQAHYLMSIVCLAVLSIGEVVWSPKLYEYTAAIAPPGQEGTYLGLSMVPWFLAKTLVSAISGHLLARWCPEGIAERMIRGEVRFWDSPAAMWLLLAASAMLGCLLALALRPWFTRGLNKN